MKRVQGPPPSDSEDDDHPFQFAARLKKQAVAHVHTPGGACCAPPRLTPTAQSCHPVASEEDPARKFECGLCDSKFKQKGSLKQHMQNVHDVGVVWKECGLCDSKFKQTGNLKRHMAIAHDVGVVFHHCSLCDSKFKYKEVLQRHMLYVHDVGVVFHHCSLCDSKFKLKGNLKAHMAQVHGVGVVFHQCCICDSKFKKKWALQIHMAAAHDVGVTWHSCDVPGCKFRAKEKCNLTVHISRWHNDVYVGRMKKQEERVREALLAGGYVEHFATAGIPPVGSFKREKRIDFRCADVQSKTAYCRIDFVVATRGGLVFLEVDEDQHLYGYDASVSCDMKRMSHVMESLTVELGDALPHVYWLRYNPNAYHVDGDLVRVPKADREKRLLGWLSGFESPGPLGIGYAFYDEEDGMLSVLDNGDYSPHYAEVVQNLGQMLDTEE